MDEHKKDSEEEKIILPDDYQPEGDNSALADYIASEQEAVNR